MLAAPAIVREVLGSRGQPLDPQTRAFMEPRFGHDFSKVRVHSDARAASGSSRSGDGSTIGPQLSTAPKLQRQGTSHEGGGTPGACVIREEIPSSRGGLINGGGTVGERFQVAIQWRDSPAAQRDQPGSYCDCACGEYRQYVKGHLIINGNRETWHLWGGAVLEDNVYHEDGLDKNPAARYGHRREPITMDEEFQTDRENGCTYIGRDFPRVMIGSDTDMLFQFKGQTYDTCNQTFGPIHEWEVRYNGPINR